ncbi:LysM peptidoglycan-binding domain-containing protein [uncultured Nostoc sp.]|uniref:LysM peptidoglycan-binding domain-containing protein n=1 Tax=uncultured Nostoc sp. TaxID=340711 RepID=UPI0035CC3E27
MTVTRGQDYKVQEGDNLLKIAQQAGVPLQALIDANNTILIQGPDYIEPDWILHIP